MAADQEIIHLADKFPTPPEPGPEADLYLSLLRNEKDKVIQACRNVRNGPLHRMTIHNDTVLHMACNCKQPDLVHSLLELLPKDSGSRLANIKNDRGNTIFHEVATSYTMNNVAKEMLKRDSELLYARNHLGESPIFSAARCGETKMFKFLVEEMKLTTQKPEDRNAFLQRYDRTTVLHISILANCFDMATKIAKDYPELIPKRDRNSMTAFQYLACKSGGIMKRCNNFKKDETIGSNLRRGLESLFSDATLYSLLLSRETWWNVESINSQAMEPGTSKKEVEIEDNSELSQETTEVPCIASQNPMEKEGQSSQKSSAKINKNITSDESPLFIAIMSDNAEIVNLILRFHPQAIEEINKKGRNILHVAILHRRTEVFEAVTMNNVLAGRLMSAVDNKGNSLLHMVGKKRKTQATEKMEDPLVQLGTELHWFERVEKVCDSSSVLLNHKNQTAEELFAANYNELRKDAKEWLVRTSSNCSIVAVFIATVAFAAAYTVPGGPDQSTGVPVLKSQPFFVVFIIADMISLTLALTSVGTFISILTSPFQLKDLKQDLREKLRLGFVFLILSMAMMGVAFGATIILIMTHNKRTWTNAVWYMLAFLPVPIFVLSYSPLLKACRDLLFVLSYSPLLKACRDLLRNVMLFNSNKSEAKSTPPTGDSV